jgi:hypothetical protein
MVKLEATLFLEETDLLIYLTLSTLGVSVVLLSNTFNIFATDTDLVILSCVLCCGVTTGEFSKTLFNFSLFV